MLLLFCLWCASHWLHPCCQRPSACSWSGALIILFSVFVCPAGGASHWLPQRIYFISSHSLPSISFTIHRERASGSTHLQLVAGTPSWLFCTSNFAYFRHIITCLPSVLLSIIHRERASGSTHLQLVAGTPSWLYWTSNFAWDIVQYSLSATSILVLVACYQLPQYSGPRCVLVCVCVSMRICKCVCLMVSVHCSH